MKAFMEANVRVCALEEVAARGFAVSVRQKKYNRPHNIRFALEDTIVIFARHATELICAPLPAVAIAA